MSFIEGLIGEQKQRVLAVQRERQKQADYAKLADLLAARETAPQEQGLASTVQSTPPAGSIAENFLQQPNRLDRPRNPGYSPQEISVPRYFN